MKSVSQSCIFRCCPPVGRRAAALPCNHISVKSHDDVVWFRLFVFFSLFYRGRLCVCVCLSLFKPNKPATENQNPTCIASSLMTLNVCVCVCVRVCIYHVMRLCNRETEIKIAPPANKAKKKNSRANQKSKKKIPRV